MRCDPARPCAKGLFVVNNFISLVVGLMALGLTTSLLAQASFVEQIVGTSADPTALETGDFNLDGALDLAVIASDELEIFLGDGQGGFSSAGTTLLGAGARDLVVADLNADGMLDVITADQDAASLTRLFGTGTGSFTIASRVQAFGVLKLALGDLDGDGDLDLAATIDSVHPGANDTIRAYLNDGLGNFTFGPTSFTGLHTIEMEVTDLNGDGHQDILVSCEGLLTGIPSGMFAMIGDGTATFLPLNPLLGFYSDFARGDFNGDGVLDLVVNGRSMTSCMDTISVFPGVTGTTFGSEQPLPTTCGPHFVTVADFDLDTHLDVAVSDPLGPPGSGAGAVSFHWGAGDGTFPSETTVAVGAGTGDCIAADFNGDGRPDLAVLNGAASSLSVLFNQPVGPVFLRGDVGGDGTLQIDDVITLLGYLFQPGAPLLGCLDAGDFDDDGIVVIGDVVQLLAYLFQAAPGPAEPFPNCGVDPSLDSLSRCSPAGC